MGGCSFWETLRMDGWRRGGASRPVGTRTLVRSSVGIPHHFPWHPPPQKCLPGQGLHGPLSPHLAPPPPGARPPTAASVT